MNEDIKNQMRDWNRINPDEMTPSEIQDKILEAVDVYRKKTHFNVAVPAAQFVEEVLTSKYFPNTDELMRLEVQTLGSFVEVCATTKFESTGPELGTSTYLNGLIINLASSLYKSYSKNEFQGKYSAPEIRDLILSALEQNKNTFGVDKMTKLKDVKTGRVFSINATEMEELALVGALQVLSGMEEGEQ